VGLGLTAAVLLSYGGQYARVKLGSLPEGPHRPEAQALFAYVRAEVPADAVLLFQAPRAMALYTGRQALAHHPQANDAQLWQDLERHGATHIVVARPLRRLLLSRFVATHAECFEKIFANEEFQVYRIRECRAGLVRGPGREVKR
jgi:hypothetical protein